MKNETTETTETKATEVPSVVKDGRGLWLVQEGDVIQTLVPLPENTLTQLFSLQEKGGNKFTVQALTNECTKEGVKVLIRRCISQIETAAKKNRELWLAVGAEHYHAKMVIVSRRIEELRRFADTVSAGAGKEYEF